MDSYVVDVAPKENNTPEAYMIHFEYAVCHGGVEKTGWCEAHSYRDAIAAAKTDFIYVVWGLRPTVAAQLARFKLRMRELRDASVKVSLSPGSLRQYASLQQEEANHTITTLELKQLQEFRNYFKDRDANHSV